MKTRTEYFVLWDSPSSQTGWKHHGTHRTAKAARNARDRRGLIEPHLKWKAVKCVTTDLK